MANFEMSISMEKKMPDLVVRQYARIGLLLPLPSWIYNELTMSTVFDLVASIA